MKTKCYNEIRQKCKLIVLTTKAHTARRWQGGDWVRAVRPPVVATSGHEWRMLSPSEPTRGRQQGRWRAQLQTKAWGLNSLAAHLVSGRSEAASGHNREQRRALWSRIKGARVRYPGTCSGLHMVRVCVFFCCIFLQGVLICCIVFIAIVVTNKRNCCSLLSSLG